METIHQDDLPALCRAADHSAQVGQRRLLIATSIRLMTLVAAAVFGALSLQTRHVDIAAIGAATSLGAALVTEVYLLTARPDRIWYRARATAESAKSLAWRYIVGGQPFEHSSPDDERRADRLLLHRFRSITASLPGIALVPPADGEVQVTTAMRRLRALPLEMRQRRYMLGRIKDQRVWYAAKAAKNERLAARWSTTLAAIEALGLLGAVLKVAELVNVDLAGIAGAAAAAGVAWIQTKQHQQLANSYSVAAHELAAIASQAELPDSEAEWAHFVDEAEEAISREHTLWAASRG